MYLKAVQDGKDLRVRFLQEPEDWYTYREHYSKETNFFPCTQDESCPGCSSESERVARSSKRYVANVLDVAQGKVVPLKMPIDLANRVINKCDRNQGTLLDRDFTLIRTGKGMNDTSYDVEAEDKTQVDISRYELVDIEKMVAEIYYSVFGDNPQPVKDTSYVSQKEEEVKALREQLAQQGSVAGQTVSEPPKAPVVESGPVQATAPTTPTTETSGDDVISIEALKEMDGPALRKLCADNGITPPDGCIDRQSLLDWLLAEFGVE